MRGQVLLLLKFKNSALQSMHAFPMQNKVHMQTAALAEVGFDTKTESSPLRREKNPLPSFGGDPLPPLGGGAIPLPPLGGEEVLSFLAREERRKPLPFKGGEACGSVSRVAGLALDKSSHRV